MCKKVKLGSQGTGFFGVREDVRGYGGVIELIILGGWRKVISSCGV
jgi:hypothetical protein